MSDPIPVGHAIELWPAEWPFRFLHLPLEIQTQIARTAARVPGRLMPLTEPGREYKPRPGPRNMSALLQTNRYVYASLKKDFFEEFYGQNLFQVFIKPKLFKTIRSVQNLASMQRITIHVQNRLSDAECARNLYGILKDVIEYVPRLRTLTLQFVPDHRLSGSELKSLYPFPMHDQLTAALIEDHSAWVGLHSKQFTTAIRELLMLVKDRFTIITLDTPSRFKRFGIAIAPSVQWNLESWSTRVEWEDLTLRARRRAIAALRTIRYDDRLVTTYPLLPSDEREELRAWTIYPGENLEWTLDLEEQEDK